MNLRWEAFRAGASMVVGTGRARRGHRFVVVDLDIRARRCVRALAGQGMPARDIAQTIRRPLCFVKIELEKIQQMGC